MAMCLSDGHIIIFLCLILLSVINIHCFAEDIFIRSSENVICQSRICLTLDEFARNSNHYAFELGNNSIFFSSGNHQLNHHLRLNKVSNVVFTSFNETRDSTLLMGKLVSVLLIKCNNITISNLVFKIDNGDSTTLRQFPLIAFQKTTGFLIQLSVLGYVSIESYAAIEIYLSHFKIIDVMIVNLTSYYDSTGSGGGAALSAFNSTLSFHGVNIFANNNVIDGSGGALLFSASNITFFGKAFFVNNTTGLSLNGRGYNYGGGAIYGQNAMVSFTGLATFTHNQAKYIGIMQSKVYRGIMGGAVLIMDSTMTFEARSTVSFIDNIAALNGGAISVVSGSQLVIDGKTSLRSNTACEGGGGLFVSKSKLLAKGALFEMNSAGCNGEIEGHGGAIEVFIADIMTFSRSNIFLNNRATLGGALYITESVAEFTDFQTFKLNFAYKGGALALSDNSKLKLSEPLQANFIYNGAKYYGGAIFFEDEVTISKCTDKNKEKPIMRLEDTCFIELNYISTEFSNISSIQLNFIHNLAGSAGVVLHGGDLDSCKLKFYNPGYNGIISFLYCISTIQVIQKISNIVNNDRVTSVISSDPLRICICFENSEDNTFELECDPLSVSLETIRGKEFTIHVVTIGQNKSFVPSFVRTSLDNEIQISAKQRVQRTGKKCTPITYSLFSANNLTTLVLFPDGPCRDTGISRLEIGIEFLPCPDGFFLRGSECVCDENLQKYTTKCNVNDNSIERLSNTFWMGTLYDNGSYEGLILHSSCPLDYCMDTPVYIKLDDLNIQCSHNHAGALCGSCNTNYSIAFGTLHCLRCSNGYLALLIPFALAGIALVIILLLLQLTVASGMMNGLIFYANVIQASRATFFTPGDTNILTVFIAWMNLDLGIETCFYDGMSVYVFTWLQFLFPFYVWFLIFLIIKLSRHSRRIARIFGTNPVSVLATLFLLSYSKILRAIILALSTSSLEYPDGTLKQVWLYDGSVPYFQRADHITLGAFAIVILLLLFLPYTLLLLFGHFLQAYSHWCILSWLNKIKPFMDTYHAPYKKETRYWTGLTLLLRCALFLTFALTSQGSNLRIDLVVITSISAGLATLAWIHRGIYEKISLDILESSFILNLCIFAVATYHVNKSMQRQISHVFVGISFAIFICIILYHIYLSLSKTLVWQKLLNTKSRISEKVIKMCKLHQEDQNRQLINEQPQDLSGKVNAPTTSTVELCEPLLLDTDTHSYQ